MTSISGAGVPYYPPYAQSPNNNGKRGRNEDDRSDDALGVQDLIDALPSEQSTPLKQANCTLTSLCSAGDLDGVLEYFEIHTEALNKLNAIYKDGLIGLFQKLLESSKAKETLQTAGLAGNNSSKLDAIHHYSKEHPMLARALEAITDDSLLGELSRPFFADYEWDALTDIFDKVHLDK